MAKQRFKKRANTVRMGASPTKERRRQNGGVVMETVERDAHGRELINRYRAAWECPLDAYRDLNVIGEPEYRAGLRFHRAYYGVVFGRRYDFKPTNNYLSTMEPNMSERLLKQAYDTLPTDELGAVIDVCGHGERIWNPRALDKLRKGLGHLAIRWHMTAIEVCEHKRKTT